MAQFARDMRISRRSWLVAGLWLPVFGARAAERLSVTFDGDGLHPVVPTLHFLSGKPLDRLKDGATVVFLSQLTLFSDDRGTVFRSARDRLIVSYDLWEEKFSVTVPGIASRPKAHLSAPQAEAWCLENLAISASGLAPDRPFWLRFELRTADQRELASVMGEPGISLTALIEVFSRKPGADDPHWTLSGGPFRLADLARTLGRGTRNG